MTMMNDDSRDEDLRKQLEHYNPPPPVPRDSLRHSLFGDEAGSMYTAAQPLSKWRRFHLPVAAALAASLAVFCVGALAGLLLAGRLDRATDSAVTESSTGTSTAGQTDAAGFHRVVWF